jgi:hypothetical protein
LDTGAGNSVPFVNPPTGVGGSSGGGCSVFLRDALSPIS